MDHSTGSQHLLARCQNQAHCLDGGSFQRKLLGETGHCVETVIRSYNVFHHHPLDTWRVHSSQLGNFIGNFNDSVSVVLSSRSLEQCGDAAPMASLAGFLGSLFFGG